MRLYDQIQGYKVWLSIRKRALSVIKRAFDLVVWFFVWILGLYFNSQNAPTFSWSIVTVMLNSNIFLILRYSYVDFLPQIWSGSALLFCNFNSFLGLRPTREISSDGYSTLQKEGHRKNTSLFNDLAYQKSDKGFFVYINLTLQKLPQIKKKRLGSSIIGNMEKKSVMHDMHRKQGR
jgi:hypothetical protein